MHTLPHSVPLTLQQATTNPHLCWRLLDTHRQVWVSLLWDHCSFVRGPGAHKVLFVSSKSLFPQSNISSVSSVVGLMATSSKRAYVIPSSAAPRAPAPVAAHCWPLPPQETLQHSSSSVSVGCLAVILPVAIFKTYFSYNHISPRTFMPLNTIILISQK